MDNQFHICVFFSVTDKDDKSLLDNLTDRTAKEKLIMWTDLNYSTQKEVVMAFVPSMNILPLQHQQLDLKVIHS